LEPFPERESPAFLQDVKIMEIRLSMRIEAHSAHDFETVPFQVPLPKSRDLPV
jgi:hypothetical protein